MKHKIGQMSFGLLLVVITGCATIVGGGPTQDVTVNSNPPGAAIFVAQIDDAGNLTGETAMGLQTPASVSLNRKGDWVVILKKEGFQDFTITPSKDVNPWFFGNILIGGLIGSGVDSSTGSINAYDSDGILAELQPE